MKQVPQIFTAEELSKWNVDAEIDGKWVRARPLSMGTLVTRVKIAYKVFIGEYDALKWYKQ